MQKQIHKSSAQIYFLILNCVLGCFFYGYMLGYMSLSFNTIDIVYGISNKDTVNGLISGLLCVGGGVGAFGGGLILMVLSRKESLMAADIIAIIGIGLSQIKILSVLCISRFIAGIAVGLNTAIIPIYIKEYSPLAMRGVTGTMNQISVNLGILLGELIGAQILSLKRIYPTKIEDIKPDAYDWRIVFAVPLVFCFIRSTVFTFIYSYDPPAYYVSQSDENKALEVLQDIYKEPYINQQLEELQKENRLNKQSASTYGDLLKPNYKKRLLIGCLLCVLQQFSGINSVIFYSGNIFESIFGEGDPKVYYLTIAVGVTNLVFSILAGYLIKNMGRKQLLLLGNILCFVCLAILFGLSTYNEKHKGNSTIQDLIIFFLFLFLIGFQISLGPIVWIYISDILPEKGVSIAVVCNWTANSIIAFGFPIVQVGIGINYCFLIFAITCFLGIPFIIFMMKETKGKTAQSIDNMFSIQQYLLESDNEKSKVNDEDQ